MRIRISDHFTAPRLMRFALPSVVMMIFTSIYTVVDGVFVSNFAGSNALSSINIIFPAINIVGSIGFMLGTGGSAVAAMKLGQGRRDEANNCFSMIITVIAAAGVILSALGILFVRPIGYLMGASDLLIDDCVTYGIILFAGVSAFMLQTTFQTFFVVAEKPHLSLLLTVTAGVANMVLDYVFVAVLGLGIAGAAYATVIGYVIGGVIPLIYFLSPNSSLLRLKKPKFNLRILLGSCANGSSEMMTNISMSIVTLLYNLQMMRMIGEDGVAAITVIMYLNFVFVAVFLGYSMGTAPIVGYNYGAGNHRELQNLFCKSLAIIGIVGVAMTAMCILLASPLSGMFVGANPALADLATRGMIINAFSFLICGVNIYASSFYTALCNGKISALISFLRAFLLQAAMIYLLPLFFDIDGIWAALTAAELLTLIVTVICFVKLNGRYHYLRSKRDAAPEECCAKSTALDADDD